MANALSLVNGIPKMTSISASLPTVYDQTLHVVSGAPGAGEIQGPITTGTYITLPNAQTYTGPELEIYLNDTVLTSVLDFTYVGSGARTQITLTFDLLVQDFIRFRIIRNA